MPQFNFPSLAHNEGKQAFAYTVFTSTIAITTRTGREDGIAGWAGAYQTYGDELVQHSSHYPVIAEYMGDFLASLANYLLLPITTPDEHHWEKCATVASNWPRPFAERKIRFAASIKYSEEKKKWYSIDEERTTTNSTKRHDKRFKEVPSYATSVTADNVFNLFDFSYGNIIENIGRYLEIERVVCTITNQYGNIKNFFHLPEEGGSDPIMAWKTVDFLVQMHRAKEQAVRYLANYKNQVDFVKRKATAV